MSHKDAPPESPSQTACREWWVARMPHVSRSWSRTKWGTFHSELSQSLHEAWLAAGKQALNAALSESATDKLAEIKR